MIIGHFGKIPAGQDVLRIPLRGGGLTAHVLTWGGTLQDLRLGGVGHSLVLGFPSLGQYLQSSAYIGATVGRFANRIAQGQAVIAGKPYQLDCNFLGKHLLHGGAIGTDRQVWELLTQAEDTATLRLQLADGHMGFPGNLEVRLTYRLSGVGVLSVELTATTDAPTLCSFAHHSYFNLDGSATVLDHSLQIAAEHYLPIDAECIPTGSLAPVAGTAFDFRQRHAVGERHTHYDHNFCLGQVRQALRPVACLHGVSSGIRMVIETTEPGLQVYDGKWLDGGFPPHAGLALEPQGWPDAPNQPGFPTAELLPGDVYQQVTRFVFGQDRDGSLWGG